MPIDERRYCAEVLTVCAKQGRTPDYFERYGLDLEENDEATISAQFKMLGPIWSKLRLNQSYGPVINQLLGDKKNAEKTLLDSAARASYREMVRQERKAGAEKLIGEVRESVVLLCSKGYLSPVEKDQLVQSFLAKGFSEADILAQLPPNIPIVDKSYEMPKPKFDQTLAKDLEKKLRSVTKQDLYDFLGLTPKASEPEIRSRYQQEKDANDRKSNTDPIKQNAKEILQVLNTYFIVSNRRKEYDEYLEYRKVAGLEEKLKLSAADKRIDPQEYAILEKEALSLGFSADQAKNIILSLAQKYNASVEFTGATDYVSCASCHSINPKSPDVKHCERCGQALYAACPGCQSEQPKTNPACAKCGFAFDKYVKMKFLVEQGRLLLRDGEVEDARRNAIEAEKIWGIKDEVSKFRQELDRVSEIKNDLVRELAQKHYRRAREILLQLGNLNIQVEAQTLGEVRSAVTARLEEAEKLVRQAGTVSDSDQAASLCLQALEVCADYQRATEEMKKHPPRPAVLRSCSEHEGRVNLQWSASSSSSSEPIEYIVRRKPGAAPANVVDGEPVGETTGLTLSDDKVPVGRRYYYRVFARRFGAVAPGAETPEVFIAAPARDFLVRALDGKITGGWRLPEDADSQTWLVRKPGTPPSAPEDGVRLGVNSQAFEDSGLSNDVTYHYALYLVYPDQKGKAVFSAPVRAQAAPGPPPLPVSALEIADEGEGLIIRWQVNGKFPVSIFQTTTKPDFAAGGEYEYQKIIAALGRPLYSGSNDWARLSQAPTGVTYFLPVTVNGQMAVVGAVTAFLRQADVSGLEAKEFGGYIQLTWLWPDNTQNARVVWRRGRFPVGPNDPEAHGFDIQLGTYREGGGFKIMSAEATDHYISVFSCVRPGSEFVYSPGNGPSCRLVLKRGELVEISYRFKVSQLPFAAPKAVLTLAAPANLQNGPTLVLVARPGAIQPLEVSDGKEILRFSNLDLKLDEKGEARVPVPLKGVKKPSIFRLFFADPDDENRFVLRHPPAKELVFS